MAVLGQNLVADALAHVIEGRDALFRRLKENKELFRYEVFNMLKAEGKINDVVIENMMNWPPARALEPT